MSPSPKTTNDASALTVRLAKGPVTGDARGVREAMIRFRAAAEAGGLVDVVYASVDTPVGELIVVGTDDGVVAVSWDRDIVLERVAGAVSPRVLEAPARLDAVRRQLDEYFGHRRRTFDLPIDWSLTKGFRREVLRELVKVPFGEVVTYGALAQLAGSPGAGRAVGSAMAANPIPIIVPCHRVLRTGGALGGYSGRDGLVTKRYLLELEGALLPLTPRH